MSQMGSQIENRQIVGTNESATRAAWSRVGPQPYEGIPAEREANKDGMPSISRSVVT